MRACNLGCSGGTTLAAYQVPLGVGLSTITPPAATPTQPAGCQRTGQEQRSAARSANTQSTWYVAGQQRASSASRRCAEEIAIMTLASPTRTSPTRCAMAAACSVQRLCAVSQSSCDGSSLVALAACMPLVARGKTGSCSLLLLVSGLAASLCPRFSNAKQPRSQRSWLCSAARSSPHLQLLRRHWRICLILELDDALALEVVACDASEGRDCTCAVTLYKVCVPRELQWLRHNFH